MSPALTDGLGRRHTTLRLSIAERCTLRCRYCMPAEGLAWTPNRDLLTTDELVRLAVLFARLGVTTVRLTGGEPLVRPDAVEVVRRISALGVPRLAMTTNGLALEPQLPALREAGLTALTLSLDTLRADRFRLLTRRDGLDRVLGALAAAVDAGYGIGGPRPLKVNAVVLRGVNDDEVAALAGLALRLPVEVRFIEWMPFAGLGWGRESLVPWTETRAALEAVHGPLVSREDAPDATAQTFRFSREAPGRVGFIASMTAPFCRGCSRLRVSADGALSVCLFARESVPLRDALRAGATDPEIETLVVQALRRKAPAHGGRSVAALAETADAGRAMITIGG